MVDVVAINRKRRLAITDDDRLVPITNLIDSSGEETDDVDEAITGVVRVSEHVWVVVVFADYPIAK